MQNNERWAEEIIRIADILSKAGLESATKWGAEVFTYNGRNVLSYGGFKQFFAIWFYNGVFLSDPYKVLVTASEGKTKSLRQWRFTSGDEIDEAKILRYVQEAIEIEKKGLKIAPGKHQAVAIPDLLATALVNDQQLKQAFESLSSGKQKEYCLHISEAKQEVTQQKRLEKSILLILAGKGLYDKYKNC